MARKALACRRAKSFSTTIKRVSGDEDEASPQHLAHMTLSALPGGKRHRRYKDEGDNPFSARTTAALNRSKPQVSAAVPALPRLLRRLKDLAEIFARCGPRCLPTNTGARSTAKRRLARFLAEQKDRTWRARFRGSARRAKKVAEEREMKKIEALARI